MKTKISLLLLITLLISSCSTKFAYNYLDWAIEWYIEDLVTLNNDQEWDVTEAAESTLAWHRKNQLPFYIKTLNEAEDAFKQGISLKFLKRFYFSHEKGWMDLKYHITPTLAGLLKTLDDHQVNELEQNMKEQEEELVSKYVDKPQQELVSERTERMIDRLEPWIGELSKQQIQLVVNWSHQVKTTTNQWSSSRQQWQAHFIKIVRDYRKTSQFHTLMLEHFQNSRKYWPKGYEESYYQNIDLTLNMIVKIGNELSKKQKEHLLEEIGELKEQLIEIVEDQ